MGGMIEIVEPRQVRDWVAAGEVDIVDVREADEYAKGHIPGARSMPLSRFDAGGVTAAPGRRLVVHCHSGQRCGPASEILVAAGKGPVARLRGGVIGWMAAGGPLTRD